MTMSISQIVRRAMALEDGDPLDPDGTARVMNVMLATQLAWEEGRAAHRHGETFWAGFLLGVFGLLMLLAAAGWLRW